MGDLSEANRAIFLKAKVGITDVLPAFRHFANPLDVLNQIMDMARSEGPHPEQIAENANCSSPGQLLAESASYPGLGESVSYSQAEFDECGQIGERDGYERAVADIDRLTGGDGEFYVSTVPGRGCSDVETMKARIVERFNQRPGESGEWVMVPRAMLAKVTPECALGCEGKCGQPYDSNVPCCTLRKAMIAASPPPPKGAEDWEAVVEAMEQAMTGDNEPDDYNPTPLQRAQDLMATYRVLAASPKGEALPVVSDTLADRVRTAVALAINDGEWLGRRGRDGMLPAAMPEARATAQKARVEYIMDALPRPASDKGNEPRPTVLHHHDRHPWAQSGDQPERLWMLVFSDAEQGVMTWRGDDAEKEAREAYARYQVTWTCSLLATVEARPVPGVSREEVARKAAAWFGLRNFEAMAKDRADLRMKIRSEDGFDINEATQDDCLEFADKMLALLSRGEG